MKITTKKVNDDLAKIVKEVVVDIGGISKYIKKGDRVLVKPNFNTADLFPASSDPEFIKASLSLIYSAHPKEVILGESCTFSKRTSKVMDKIGIDDIKLEFPELKVLNFDEDNNWVTKKLENTQYLKTVTIPKILDGVDKIIYLPCLKTHSWAQYTGALKLSIGLLNKAKKIFFHTGHLQQKIAELNLAVTPDLIIMDARKCFITKGPSHGEVAKPNKVLASTSRIMIDTAGIKIIQQFDNNDLEGIKAEELLQIKYAQELGIR